MFRLTPSHVLDEHQKYKASNWPCNTLFPFVVKYFFPWPISLTAGRQISNPSLLLLYVISYACIDFFGFPIFLSTLSKIFLRASSASEAMERPTRRDDESKNTGPLSNSVSDGNEAPVNSNLQVPDSGGPIRPRSSSHSGRFPFFDFSMIPDKDPHFNDGSSGREEKRRYRRASSSSASNTSSVRDMNIIKAAENVIIFQHLM